MTDFILVEQDRLDSLPEEAIRFLDSASRSMDNYFPVGRATQQARDGTGWIYLIRQGKRLVGAFFANYRCDVEKGVIYNLPLLGGDDIDSWSGDLIEFLKQKTHDIGASEFVILGRRGWGRMFPQLEHIACLYRKKLSLVSDSDTQIHQNI